ncbi:MAG: 2-hydroxyacid dehydrogenase [Deinococcales bacterium]
MRVLVFSTKPYDRQALTEANLGQKHELHFLEGRLLAATATLATGFEAVCAFVNDDLSAPVLEQLASGGTRLVVLRSAGFNHVNLEAAQKLGLTVARVPAYSPHAVAEHAVALVLALNRKIHRAYNRVREGNFTLEGLLGFDLNGKSVGVVGTGKIGQIFAQIMAGFGCRVLAFDPSNDSAKPFARYVSWEELLHQSDIISLHCPLIPQTYHLIDAQALRSMRPQVMLINTSRGGLISTPDVIEGLKSGQIGALGLDVYEEESDLFFEDLSNQVIADDVFSRLLTFPNVIITGHQGFFTREALANIAQTTIDNLSAFETGEGTLNSVPLPATA